MFKREIEPQPPHGRRRRVSRGLGTERRFELRNGACEMGGGRVYDCLGGAVEEGKWGLVEENGGGEGCVGGCEGGVCFRGGMRRGRRVAGRGGEVGKERGGEFGVQGLVCLGACEGGQG